MSDLRELKVAMADSDEDLLRRAETAEEAVVTLTRYADSLSELNGEMAGNYAEALTRADTAQRERDEARAKVTQALNALSTPLAALRRIADARSVLADRPGRTSDG